jgi:UDP-N-acetylmuramate-alanine ligase
MNISLNKINKIYFVGIKGVAMSGLAVICKKKGMDIAGSDVSEKFITDKILQKNEIKVFENFSPDNLDFNPDLAVVGASWSDDNVEVKEIKKRNIALITDSEMRGLLSREKETIAITGVHGKTTTTALMAYLFNQAGLDPSFLIGTGVVPDLGTNAYWSNRGNYFIVEGDEYVRSKKDQTPKFLDLDPTTTVITSLEWEHVDIYRDIEAIKKPFRKLIEKTKEMVVVCGDWPSIKEISVGFENKVVTYGFEKSNLWRAYDICQELDKTFFKVKKAEAEIGEFELKLHGEHNVLNALAVIIVGLSEGIRLKKINDA